MPTIEEILLAAEESYLQAIEALEKPDYEQLSSAIAARDELLKRLDEASNDRVVGPGHDGLLARVKEAEKAFIDRLEGTRRELARDLAGRQRQRRGLEKYSG